MSRLTFILCAFFATILMTLASPIPASNGTLVELEKRITHTGRGTWFHPGLGNCGKYNGDNDMIVAISKQRYDANRGANCDQYVQIDYNGKRAYALTRDSCQSCNTESLDMSPAVFQKLAPLSKGQITITWQFKAKGFRP